jgi:hypothetical protein
VAFLELHFFNGFPYLGFTAYPIIDVTVWFKVTAHKNYVFRDESAEPINIWFKESAENEKVPCVA